MIHERTLYMLLLLMSLFSFNLQAQSFRVEVNRIENDSFTVKFKGKNEICLSNFRHADNKAKDVEVVDLMKQIRKKYFQFTMPKPYGLRFDFSRELDSFLKEDYKSELPPKSLMKLLKPQPITYNMSKEGYNGYYFGVHYWVIVDVPEFYVSDYDIETNTDWFWAEDWR